MRTQRSLKSYLTRVGYSATAMTAGIIATPYLLRWLGSERYGAYLVALDWLGYLALLEFGLGEAFIPLAANAKSPPEVRQYLITSVKAYIRLIPLKLIVGLILVFFSTRIITAHPELSTDLRIACSLGVASSLLSVFIPFRMLLEVNQQSYLLNQLLMGQVLLATALSLIFAHQGMGITGQYLALFIGSLPVVVTCARRVERTYPNLLSDIIHTPEHLESRSSLLRLNKVMFLANLCSRIGFLTDGILVAFFLNAASAAQFYITQKAILLAQTLLFAIGNATWAALIELYNKGEQLIFKKRLVELTRLTVIGGSLSLGPIIALNSTFIGLWVGDSQYAGDAVTLLGSINILLIALTSLWSWMFGASGLAARILPSYVIATALNLGASFFFTWKLGLSGPLLGSVIANLGVTFWVLPRYLERHFNVPMKEIFAAVYRPLAVQIPAVGILVWFTHRMPALGWTPFLLYALSALAFMIAVNWWLVLTHGEKKLWRDRIKTAIAAYS